MKKFYFNNTNVLMYSISVKNSTNKIIIYKFDDLYQVNNAQYYSVGDKMQFNLKTIDNNMFYSLQMDSENRVGNFSISNNILINKFNNDIYSKTISKNKTSTSKSTVLRCVNNNDCPEGSECWDNYCIPCCRNASSWDSCMDCTVSACGSEWWCVAALVAAGPEVLAGMAASCIGAGPNTFC